MVDVKQTAKPVVKKEEPVKEPVEEVKAEKVKPVRRATLAECLKQANAARKAEREAKAKK